PHPVLDLPAGAVPLRPLPSPPRCPVRGHRRGAVAGRPGAARRARRLRQPKERTRLVSYDVSNPVPIPADIDIPDKIVAGLTVRQVAITANTGSGRTFRAATHPAQTITAAVAAMATCRTVSPASGTA